MSPLERILLAAHEERMAATSPKDLPRLARDVTAREAAAAARLLTKTERDEARKVRRVEANKRAAAAKLAWVAKKRASIRLNIRTRSTAAVLAGATWTQAAEACGVGIRALGQAWFDCDEPPEVTEARREHYRAKVAAGKARRAAQVSP